MAKLENISIDLTGIGAALIRSKKLHVPIYQRSYAWEEKNVRDLFDDIRKAIDSKEAEYFLGSIVITENDSEKPAVVDGQQRLATIIILLAAIRDWWVNSGDKDRAAKIESDYLSSKDLKTLDIIPKLELNLSDHNFFLNTILSPPNDTKRNTPVEKESHNRIQHAANIIKQKIEELTDTENPTERLISWVEYISDSLKVIWVKVPNDANAFTIFETLNDRGLVLAISDLLKNYLFGRSGDRISEVQQRWTGMTSTFEALDSEGLIVSYIRNLWSSKYGLTREKDLYTSIKAEISSKANALEFSNDLYSSAKIYAAIINTDNDLWHRLGDKSKNHMATINQLRMLQIRPLLLAMLKNFNENEIKKAIKMLHSVTVRLLIHGGLGGGTLESYYCEAAKDISDKKIKSKNDLRKTLIDIIPTDKQFATSFENATVSKTYLARYYLRTLERQVNNEPDPELLPNEDPEVVNLEHILPNTLSEAWAHINSDDHVTHLKRIGNLALMKAPENDYIGNESFDAKKKVYATSKLTLTKSVSKYSHWDIEAINNRQKELAKLAVEAWPI